MDLYSPAAKQVIASNQRTDSLTSLGLLRLPHNYLSVAPPLSSRLFLPRIMIRANNYIGAYPLGTEKLQRRYNTVTSPQGLNIHGM